MRLVPSRFALVTIAALLSSQGLASQELAPAKAQEQAKEWAQLQGPVMPSPSSPPAGESSPTVESLQEIKAAALELVRAGRFAQALPMATEGLRQAQILHGPDSIETAIAAHNLGFVQRRVDQVPAGQANLERALSIYERVRPAVHEDIRNLLGELGRIYQSQGRAGDVAALYARQIARATDEGYGEHVGVAHMLTNRGFLLRGEGRGDESEAAFVWAVQIYERNLAFEGEAYRLALEAVFDRFVATKRTSQATALAQAAIGKLAARRPATNGLVARLHNRLSEIALEAGRHQEARSHARSALVSAQDAPSDGAAGKGLDQTTAAHNNLARASRALADFGAAEANYRRAIERLDGRGDKANAGILNDNLAVLLMHQGRLDDAERHAKRALALLEETLGRGHANVGRSAGNLGAVLNEAGRYAEAEPLLRRALEIAQSHAAADPVSAGVIEDNLAGLLRVTGRAAEAHAHIRHALAVFEQALPAEHPRTATTRNNLGRSLLDQGAFAEAEAQTRKALTLAEEIYGVESVHTAVPAANLGEALAGLKRYEEARLMLGRALTVLEVVHGTTHPSLIETLVTAGRVELADGKTDDARRLFERAVASELSQRARRGIEVPEAASDRGRSGPFSGLLDALWRGGKAAEPGTAARALEVGQWETMTAAAAALAALGARSGAGDAGASALTRERQDLAAAWRGTDRRLTELLAQTGVRDTSLEVALRDKLAAIEERLAATDAELALRFPRFRDLARPSALPLDEVRRLLSAHEAAVQIVVSAAATDVWLVSGAELIWYRVPIGARDLQSLVRSLRCGLDRSEWDGAGARRCATLLGRASDASPAAGEPLPFDTRRAHALYKLLLQPLETAMAGKDLLFVVTGALTALPLQVLITEPSPNASPYELAGVSWLGSRHAITTLPSLASLASLRRAPAPPSAAARPFLGIGNPLLTGSDGNDRRASEATVCGMPSGAMSAWPTVPARQALPLGRRSNLAELRRQAPLPETADELCRVALTTGATSDDVLLGARATEAEVKALSASGRLAQARIVHFATHGLLAGETARFIAERAEPSLMLTPPDTAGEDDDGLLTASEIAMLKLDADWVILSACNTAGGDAVGAEALSGLARAFFYAGARSLLVSHWAVDSDATVKLVTATFEAMSREPGLTHAQALSKAVAGMIAAGGHEGHPASWAPFVVVGGSVAPAARSVAPATALPATLSPPAKAPPPMPTMPNALVPSAADPKGTPPQATLAPSHPPTSAGQPPAANPGSSAVTGDPSLAGAAASRGKMALPGKAVVPDKARASSPGTRPKPGIRQRAERPKPAAVKRREDRPPLSQQ